MTETYRELLNDMKPLPWGIDSLRSILATWDARSQAVLKWVQAAEDIAEELEYEATGGETQVHDFICTECGDYLARVDKRALVPSILLRLSKDAESLEQVPLDRLTKEQMLPLLISLVIENDKLKEAVVQTNVDAGELAHDNVTLEEALSKARSERSCNLHSDCAAEDLAAAAQGTDVLHCNDAECSDHK